MKWLPEWLQEGPNGCPWRQCVLRWGRGGGSGRPAAFALGVRVREMAGNWSAGHARREGHARRPDANTQRLENR